jgi:hypothetical protein
MMESTNTLEGRRISSGIAGWMLVPALALGLAFAGPTPTAQADDAALTKYAGAYKYAGTKEQAEKVVSKAIDDALSQLNMVMRMMVKKAIEMRPGQKFIDTILIETPSGQIGIKMGEHEKVVLKVNKPKTMERDGQKGKVTHKWAGGKITQVLEGDKGTVTNVLTLTKDGKTLHRDVTITSDRLEKPIKYRLSYKRK